MMHNTEQYGVATSIAGGLAQEVAQESIINIYATDPINKRFHVQRLEHMAAEAAKLAEILRDLAIEKKLALIEESVKINESFN